MPMDITLYPPEWPQVAAALKVAAEYRCQRCGARQGDAMLNRYGLPCKVVITVAHVNHDVWNPRAELAVLCARCHLRYDARQRRRQRRMMQIARGQLFWKEGMAL